MTRRDLDSPEFGRCDGLVATVQRDPDRRITLSRDLDHMREACSVGSIHFFDEASGPVIVTPDHHALLRGVCVGRLRPSYDPRFVWWFEARPPLPRCAVDRDGHVWSAGASGLVLVGWSRP